MKNFIIILLLIASIKSNAQFYFNVSAMATKSKTTILPGVETAIGYSFKNNTIALYNSVGKGQNKLLGLQYSYKVKAGKKSYMYGCFTVIPFNSFIVVNNVKRDEATLNVFAVDYGAGYKFYMSEKLAVNASCKVTSFKGNNLFTITLGISK